MTKQTLPLTVALVDEGLIVRSSGGLIEGFGLRRAKVIPDERGRLGVKISGAEPREHDVLVSVSDNGIGISPEQMGSLFEPYRTTKSSGTGLGLLIVRRIIREHGGEIEILSNPDEGTSILIHLPHTAPSPRLLPPPIVDA